jgi:hypothetical protein
MKKLVTIYAKTMTNFERSTRYILSDDEYSDHCSSYSYDEEEDEEEFVLEGVYHDCFPNQWRETHLPGTGPEECTNCAYYGCINSVFIGYCANCAINVYNGTRGRGFIDIGVEYITEETLGFQSVFDTYLFEVELYPPALPFNEEGEENENLTDEDIYGPETGLHDPMWDMPHYENGYNDY